MTSAGDEHPTLPVGVGWYEDFADGFGPALSQGRKLRALCPACGRTGARERVVTLPEWRRCKPLTMLVLCRCHGHGIGQLELGQ